MTFDVFLPFVAVGRSVVAGGGVAAGQGVRLVLLEVEESDEVVVAIDVVVVVDFVLVQVLKITTCTIEHEVLQEYHRQTPSSAEVLEIVLDELVEEGREHGKFTSQVLHCI